VQVGDFPGVEASRRAGLVRVGTQSRVPRLYMYEVFQGVLWCGFLGGLFFLVVGFGYPWFRYPTRDAYIREGGGAAKGNSRHKAAVVARPTLTPIAPHGPSSPEAQRFLPVSVGYLGGAAFEAQGRTARVGRSVSGGWT
jgi:hypothetical protein